MTDSVQQAKSVWLYKKTSVVNLIRTLFDALYRYFGKALRSACFYSNKTFCDADITPISVFAINPTYI